MRMALLAFVFDAPSPHGLDADRSRHYHQHDHQSFDSACRHALFRSLRPGKILLPLGVTGQAVPSNAGRIVGAARSRACRYRAGTSPMTVANG